MEFLQDTVVALQALASFEKSQPKGPTNLQVFVDSGEHSHMFQVNDKNKLLQQQWMLPQIPTVVNVEMDGQGCTLVQVCYPSFVYLKSLCE